MNNPLDPLAPETEDAAPAQAKPVRRRRSAVAADAQAGLQTPGGDAIEPPVPDVAAKPARKRRATPAADAADAAGIEQAASVAGASLDAAAVAVIAPAQTDRDADRVTPSVAVASADADPTGGGQSRRGPDTRRVADLAETLDASDASPAQREPGAEDEPGAGDAPARGERSRRRNRRERQRALRAAEGAAAGDAAPQARPVAPHAAEQLGALFEQVVSGEFDVDEPGADADAAQARAPQPAPDAAGAAAEEAAPGAPAEPAADEDGAPAPAKRVLAPDPDAPKLQKVLGQAGVGSRRDMEELIAQGRITVNGEPAHTGQRISWGDRIEVNGRAIKYRIAPPPARIIAYHKPVGEVVTHDDPQQRPTVFRGLPRLQHGKWQSVGRLDINTEGLLLLTTSGELAHQLMHPRFGVEREYAVRVLGTLEPQARETLLQGVPLDGQPANFKSIEDGGGDGANRWYRVVIAEGRNREVRKLFDAVGLTVSRLIRIRYGCVVLPRGLKRGAWVDLGPDDVRLIRQLAGGARSADRQGDGAARGNRNAQGGGERGARPNDRGGRNDRPPRHEAPQGPGAAQRADRDDGDEDLDFDPMRIPNPLEQTFDRRFAKNQRSPFSGRTLAHGGGGFGAGGSAPEAAPRRSGGAKEPDPLQTSLGFIGGDAYHRKNGRGGGSGGQRGGQRSGGKGGYRGR